MWAKITVFVVVWTVVLLVVWLGMRHVHDSGSGGTRSGDGGRWS
jgi:hypothetical protein